MLQYYNCNIKENWIYPAIELFIFRLLFLSRKMFGFCLAVTHWVTVVLIRKWRCWFPWPSDFPFHFCRPSFISSGSVGNTTRVRLPAIFSVSFRSSNHVSALPFRVFSFSHRHPDQFCLGNRMIFQALHINF